MFFNNSLGELIREPLAQSFRRTYSRTSCTIL